MKKNLTNIILTLGLGSSLMAQTLVTGPSSSQSPYVLPVIPGYTVTSIITASQTVGNYTISGLPDGSGAYDNNDGTFTMLINHEAGNTAGSVRAHGSLGAFVSKLVINKTTFSVVSASDLIQNVKLWNPSSSTYSTYNSSNTSTLAAFTRFCSADLAPVNAFYNSATGKGTQERIFMNGEESGAEGRAFAHLASGPNAGTTYELPYLGKFSWENSVASPYRNDKTIVVGMDDATPGQVYVYVGNKGMNGTEIDKAGLSGGLLYGVAVNNLLTEVSGSFISANTSFSLVNLGSVQAITGASLQTKSTNLGVTQFLRPEDGAWDPARPSDFYFVTTNGFNTAGSNPSRMYRLRFNDIENPELGGTITAVLDGTEGQQMMDNIGIDNSGHIMIQEDPGNQSYNAKIWEYTIGTDAMVQVMEHDANRFITGAPNFLTQDEESSGIFDAQSILGPGKFLFVDQAHYSIPAPVMEGGQILVLSSLKTASANPEINIQGNAVTINMGNTTTSSTNNTDFGMVNVGLSINKTFVVQNTGTGDLIISGMNFTGNNAGDFTFVNPPVYPATIAAGASLTITAKYAPVLVGNSTATLNVYNNDYNENIYDFAVKATAASPEIDVMANGNSIAAGATNVSSNNSTDFGSVYVYNNITKTFTIQNTGTGTLTINSIVISGANATDFTLVNGPTTPFTLTSGNSQTFSVKYTAGATSATSIAKVTITNDDVNEGIYDFAIQAKSMIDVGLNSVSKKIELVKIFPNPANDEAVLNFNIDKNMNVDVTIFDLNGKKVKSIQGELDKGEHQIHLNTSTLATGEYIVKISSVSNIQTLKLIVSH